MCRNVICRGFKFFGGDKKAEAAICPTFFSTVFVVLCMITPISLCGRYSTVNGNTVIASCHSEKSPA